MTRVWPKRSIRRPCTGLAIALEIASAAVTAPALANEPVSRWTMSTIASGAPTLRPATTRGPDHGLDLALAKQLAGGKTIGGVS